MAARSQASELVLKLVEGENPGRGDHMQVVLQLSWLGHAKPLQALPPREQASREAVRQWLLALDPAALERVRGPSVGGGVGQRR